MHKDNNQLCTRYNKARKLTSALGESLGIAAVSAADSDTGFGRGNDAVDVFCSVVEKDDVGSVVK